MEEQYNRSSSEDKTEASQALSLNWTFGLNKDVIGSVHNISDDNRSAIFYFTAHTGVIYDYVERSQRLLQGHCNPISCATVSKDKRWIVTADEGENSVIVVWDSTTAAPIKTIPNPHKNGVKAIDLSPDDMLLVSLSSIDEDDKQEVALWEWTSENEEIFRMECEPREYKIEEKRNRKESKMADEPETAKSHQDQVRFNSHDTYEFVTTGRHHVTFWSWRNKKLESRTPATISKSDFGSRVGLFTQTLYLEDMVITATTEGNVVVWEDIGSSIEEESKVSCFPQKQAVKVINLNRGSGITFLTYQNGLIVIGGEDENVRFYDQEFRLVAWYEDLEAGSIISLSFAATSRGHMVDNPVSDAPVEIHDFVIATSRALVVGVDAAIFEKTTPEYRHGTLLLQGFDSGISAMCIHPEKEIFFAVTEKGVLQVWDYSTKHLLNVKTFHQDDIPESIAISHEAHFLAVAFKNGMLRILRWGSVCDLGELVCFQIRKGVSYNNITFASHDNTLAFSDTQNGVGLFTFVDSGVSLEDMKVDAGKRKGEPGPGLEPCDGSDSRNGWTYIGRYISHTGTVTSLTFGMSTEGKPKLISVGADGFIVDYDLETSSVVDGIILSQDPIRLEFGDCIPTCVMAHPLNKGMREEFLITASSDLKLKYVNANSKSCRKTAIGPLYGGALTKMQLLEQQGITGQYIAYATDFKVIGITKLPLDGNPYKSMGLIAHPGEITGFAVSPTGSSILSSGGSDMTINLWIANTPTLDACIVEASANSISGVSKSLIPYLSMIDGGAEGSLFQEMIDYFYYAQLRCNGEDTTSPRVTNGVIPLNEIPNLMRALGFYPSEQEIKNMCSEVKYSEFAQTAKVVNYINFEQFVKLYLNHRPVSGISQDQLESAFERVIGSVSSAEGISYKDLSKALAENGEMIPAKELESCLTMLIGRKQVQTLQPKSIITSEDFINDILGLETREQRQHK